MARPIWQNEIIGDINGDYDPHYDILVDEEELMANVKLKLKNQITQQGTSHNAANMNNLFDFDNIESMKGNTKVMQVGTSGEITEYIMDSLKKVVNAKRVTTFLANGNISELTTIYADDGKYVLRQTTNLVKFNTDGSVTEEVS